MSIAVRIKFIAGIVLTVFGFLIYLFFRKYTGELIPYPFMGFVIGVLVVVIGILLIKNSINSHNKNAQEDLKFVIQKFKSTSEKVRVDFNNCTIKTNNYIEEVEKEKGYRSQAIDAIYDSSKNVENVQVNQAVLIFETDKNGENKKYYSRTIYKDEITLRFLLNEQKETFLYIDRENRTRYYFDLEFLDD